ncbi:MAG TPA: bifunctional precorrin-2 dehydrogenase/sirohydrochlorin ferrochelatase, partial [Dehalococcoidia bacterium]
MALYPIFLETKGRPVLVIGGGHVGAEKVRGLLNGEADITVVSPVLIDELREHRDAGRIKHVAREYREDDLDGGWDFVMVATDDGAVNAEVAAAGKKRRILVNAADDPA